MADSLKDLNCAPNGDGAADKPPGKPTEDAELDDLLEDALQDFDKPALTAQLQDESSSSTHTVGSADAGSGLHASGAPPLFEAQAVESFFKSLMSGNTADVESQLANLDLDDNVASGAGDTDFAETLQRTLGNLAQSTQDLQNKDFSEEDLMKFVTDSLSGADIEGTGDEELMPMMQGMMKSLLSKDILYPSLKDISTKYPQWLETNRSQLPSEEFSRYERQHRMMTAIVTEFEAEQQTDSDEVKNRRFDHILDLMQQMQELGQPPKELVGDPPAEFELDEDGFPKMPFTGGMPSPEQCCVM